MVHRVARRAALVAVVAVVLVLGSGAVPAAAQSTPGSAVTTTTAEPGTTVTTAPTTTTTKPPPPPPGFVPLPPARLFDSRPGAATIDGAAAGGGPVAGGSAPARTFPVLGRAGIPASGVSAVVLTVTATGADAGSFVTVFPAGEDLPTASTLNVRPGQTVANLTVARLGTDGRVAVRNHAGSVHVLADVTGYVRSAATGLTIRTPARLLDTRPGSATVDGKASGIGKVTPAAPLVLDVAGRAQIPGNATAVVLNVTATNATEDTVVTVHPSDVPRPTASNLNLGPWAVVPNLVVARLGGGRVTIANLAGSVDVIADVVGWSVGTTDLVALTPARVADSRVGGPTIDGKASGTGPLGNGVDGLPGQQEASVPVLGRGNVPASGVGAVVLNVTATAPTRDTFLTVHPRGRARPGASNLNVAAGRTVANLVVARPGADGRIALYNHSGLTHVVVDVVAWFPAAAPTGRIRSWGCPEFDFNFCSSLPVDRVPTVVEGVGGASAVTAVATGWYHSLALRADGSVIAWGNNVQGALGNRSVAVSSVPVPVEGLGPGSGVVAITAGYQSSYALKADGTVLTWGIDVKTVRTARPSVRAVPEVVTPFGPGSGVTAIVAGGDSAAVVVSGDVLWLWGALATNAGAPAPVIGGVERVALGFDHLLVRFDDGRVGARGSNNEGQLGIGSVTPGSNTLLVPVGLSSGVVDVAVGFKTSYALKADGHVLAWGANTFDVLGTGTSASVVNAPRTVTNLGPGSHVVEVVAGFSHALGRRADGSVIGWGLSARGEVGTGASGTGTVVTVPTQVSGLGPTADVSRIAASGAHSLALS